ncbi:MAG: hypothetical protein IPP73_01420 [Chitinophagaceae bacterium]|nr:hypothetical protein [Chitinophagaceae bacterium]
MDFVFRKRLQFSLVVKAGDRLREFNFNQCSPEQVSLDVNVCTEKGDRLFFRMVKSETKWSINPANVPPWLLKDEQKISTAVEEALRSW